MKEKEYPEPPEYLAARGAEEEEVRKAVEAAEAAEMKGGAK